jgi:cobalt-zinc-cadmium efflux system protein
VSRSTRLSIAVALNLVLVVAQVVFGLAAHSLGLLSDAGHNLTDVAAVAISLVAVRLARRAPTAALSFGYHRGTILAALANATSILALTVVIVYEAVRRLADPVAVRGGLVVIVALGAFVINGAAALILTEHSSDLNMRSALLHMTGDAIASLGVAGAGLVILLTGRLRWLDPLVSIAIAALIAVQAYRLVVNAAEVLLESTPKDLDLAELSSAMAGVLGVDSVHDLHVWSLSSDVRALSAHLVLSGHPTLEEAQIVGERVKATVGTPFAIAHSTLELECEACEDADMDPCVMDSVAMIAARAGDGGGRGDRRLSRRGSGGHAHHH